MKIIRSLVAFTAAIVILYVAGLMGIQYIGEEKIDLSYINDVTKTVNDSYALGERQFESDGKWDVILCESNDYLAQFNNAMNDDSIITDVIYDGRLVGKVVFEKDIRQKGIIKQRLILYATVIFAFMILSMCGMCLYLYFQIIKPFKRLKTFANDVAAGNLDAPLYMTKDNYFGAFTESFDLMREELARARKSEYEANRSKKELVASLSHDIKTPVSTIKAVCEVLEIKLQDEDSINKVNTIQMKADLIDHLVSDMFHSTLEDLNVLKINPVESDCHHLHKAILEIDNFGRIKEENVLPDCLIWCDELRASQVIDNIVSNAYKYSEGKVFVHYQIQDGFLLVKIRDQGAGVPEEDMPMICEKFYRGRNAELKSGAGLGLYLSKQFMEGMKGYLECYNENGFVVELRFLLV